MDFDQRQPDPTESEQQCILCQRPKICRKIEDLAVCSECVTDDVKTASQVQWIGAAWSWLLEYLDVSTGWTEDRRTVTARIRLKHAGFKRSGVEKPEVQEYIRTHRLDK